MGPSITAVWPRIEQHAGQRFSLNRGAPFSYAVRGGALVPDRTNRVLPRGDFAKALEMVPLDGPSQIQHLQGPSLIYIYAVLMDDRIGQGDW